jgi:hypothetical protein
MPIAFSRAASRSATPHRSVSPIARQCPASSHSKVAALLSAKAPMISRSFVAVIGKAVRTDHRPVGQIAEQEVRRIRDAVFLLDAGATAERDIATADDGMAADILLGFDKDYGTACFACDNRGGQPCRPRADHDDIRLAVPVNRVLACRRAGYGSAQRPRHHPAPLPTMICPNLPVAVDREDRRPETRKTQDCRDVGHA